MKNAVVLGASSGIGRALARTLGENGYRVAVAARRLDLLEELAALLPGNPVVRAMDISRPAQAMESLAEMIEEMGGVDLFVIAAGTGSPNSSLEWEPEDRTVVVNVRGFTAVVNLAVKHLESKGSGQLVGISSISALRGSGKAPAYSASKAYMSNYLHGLRNRFAKLGLPIAVTDVQPGFVDTDLAKGDKLFWVASPEEAARQIFAAIRSRRKHVYVTRRWRLIAWLMKLLPDRLYFRI